MNGRSSSMGSMADIGTGPFDWVWRGRRRSLAAVTARPAGRRLHGVDHWLDAVANGLAAFVQRLAQLALRFLQLLKVGFPLQLAAQSIERITRLPQPAPDGARHPGQALRTKHQEGDHENDHHLREADIEHVLPR